MEIKILNSCANKKESFNIDYMMYMVDYKFYYHNKTECKLIRDLVSFEKDKYSKLLKKNSNEKDIILQIKQNDMLTKYNDYNNLFSKFDVLDNVYMFSKYNECYFCLNEYECWLIIDLLINKINKVKSNNQRYIDLLSRFDDFIEREEYI